MPARAVPVISKADARRIWLRAQRLDVGAPFGGGAAATQAAVEHLGYVQIDTIHVIERSHHHILWSRIPDYRPEHLQQAQSVDRSVFEYWTHALSYVPTRDIRFFLRDMNRHRKSPSSGFSAVTKKDLRKIVARIAADGPLTIRDIDDDVLVEKDHAWASRKPSKRALQLAFYGGELTISRRSGMLKTYELMDRHFGWEQRPAPATAREVAGYMLDRALRAQGVVSLDSICHLDAARKPAVRSVIEARVRRGALTPIVVEGADRIELWAEPNVLDERTGHAEDLVHILSPFDPLIIQRKRLQLFFDYAHRFEAYVPKDKRVLGYFALPVLIGDTVVAAVDIKADRTARKLILQKWTWMDGASSRSRRVRIEEALHRFEDFQFGGKAAPASE